MSTQQKTAEYICEQLQSLPSIHVRKMFGEYALYCKEKVVALICDNQLFVKCTDAGKTFASGRFSEGYPYPGAKPAMNVTDYLDDREFITDLVRITANVLPLPKPKKK